jgi:hypothetical protein
MAGPAEYRHEQVVDAEAQPEGRGIDEALHVHVQPARQGCQHGGDHEDHDAHACRIDAHGLGHHDAALERTDGAALARVQQVAQGRHTQQYGHPDQAKHRPVRTERCRRT